MVKEFEHIISSFIGGTKGKSVFSFPYPPDIAFLGKEDDFAVARSVNGAFLAAMSGDSRTESLKAKIYLNQVKRGSPRWGPAADFYLQGVDLMMREIREVSGHDPDFKTRLKSLSKWVSDNDLDSNLKETRERLWSVFFPEGSGIYKDRKEKTKALRRKRSVRIRELNESSLVDPAREIIFTSNVLLTLPTSWKSPDELILSERLKERLLEISKEPQLYWYDHPIQAGTEPEKNEVLYGLKGLQETLDFEKERGNMVPGGRLTCLLSLSVTHQGLHEIAKPYLEELLAGSRGLKDIDVYVFTEKDAGRLVDEILSPAAEHYLHAKDSLAHLDVFGVDGEYGRHYSFLKAVSAFWKILIQPEIRSTFKIDLDQVFPQEELVEQTGDSAFEHLMTPLWGARGTDSDGHPLELGMIAGALVNESDICNSLFFPDVLFPERALSTDEYIFFSPLTQALSTEAEMMTRYRDTLLDGKENCIYRIHVTGGTNGILVDSLRRHRPFTPSFMGRAEDQAYILSTMFNNGERMAYVHKDGLIMRHDKEAFAQEAIKASHIAKTIGDYIRILYFTGYAEAIDEDIKRIKDIVDPFTGCFISKIPISVVFLRFCFKIESLFADGDDSEGVELLENGPRRIMAALDFVKAKKGGLKDQYKKERLGWDLYYDTLSAIEEGLLKNDGLALDLREKAMDIVEGCLVSGELHA